MLQVIYTQVILHMTYEQTGGGNIVPVTAILAFSLITLRKIFAWNYWKREFNLHRDEVKAHNIIVANIVVALSTTYLHCHFREYVWPGYHSIL